MTDGINDKLKATLAYQIAAKLDAKDGTVDNKIQKNIWDEFIEGKGGKTVEEFIDIESAMKSITTYAVKNAKIPINLLTILLKLGLILNRKLI